MNFMFTVGSGFTTAAVGGGAIEFDSATQVSEASGTNTLTFAHTTGSGSNRVLLVGVGLNPTGVFSTQVTGVTYNADPMTRIGAALNYSNSPLAQEISLWYLLTPDSGANNVVVTLDDDELTGTITGCAVSYSGVGAVDTAGSTQNSASATSISTDVSSATGELVVDLFGSYQYDGTAGTNQTERVAPAPLGTNEVSLGMSQEDGAATVTMSWGTSGFAEELGIIAVALEPA